MSRPRPALLAVLLATACTGPSDMPPPDALESSQTILYTPDAPPRRVIRLDGLWEIQQGSLDTIPETFPAVCPVPGLADMAQPAFRDVGRKSPLREAFWYRRTFTVDGPVPNAAILKIRKARYGTKVWLNGRVAGEHLPCFTPAHLDVEKLLKGGGEENVLLVRVGADRDAMPRDMPGGWDFEKFLYLPGLYDSVELILTGAPTIRNVQAVPDVDAQTVRCVVEIAGAEASFPLAAKVTAWRSGRMISQAVSPRPGAKDGEIAIREIELPVPDCRLWSPEDPFLYELLVSTGADAVKVRFGMRAFRFDPASGRALLNGKPYYLRGTNVCVYRFFEDAERGDKPWRAEWVRRLHEKFKTMHWNAMRYCIGFPPDFWYDIADETGWLIQDEFPIWLLDKAPENPQAEKLIPEYAAWMRERWNHPSVVIWDAQNESVTLETGKAIRAVRRLDRSNRPWENGWAAPQDPTDCVETHPYLLIGLYNPAWSGGRKFAGMHDMAGVPGVPPLNKDQKRIPVPILINEYAWLWLNRDGSTTCLTGPVYEKLLGPDSTAAARRRFFARCLAAKTEFWRVHRACAGVLEFCALGYSRAGDKPRPEGGATSDHFLDVERQTFEPDFERTVRDAFSPVGLMLDFWDATVPAGATRTIRVYVINDLEPAWEGPVRLVLHQGGHERELASRTIRVPAWGREIPAFEVTLPGTPGPCELVAELEDATGGTVRSRREFRIQ